MPPPFLAPCAVRPSPLALLRVLCDSVVHDSCARPSSVVGRSGCREGSRVCRAGHRVLCLCHCALPVSYTHLTLPTICSV
eukprot:1765073-Prymnesium_polylepis.1